MLEGFKQIFRSLLAWYLANLILPIAMPIFFVWVCNFPTGESKSFYEIFVALLQSGVYIFTSILLVFGVFQDFKIAKQVVEWYSYLAFFFFLFIVGVMYMLDNPINSISNEFKIENEFSTVSYIFLFGIFFAGYIKLKVLWYQQFKGELVEQLEKILKKLWKS